jgi:hypothetical protein
MAFASEAMIASGRRAREREMRLLEAKSGRTKMRGKAVIRR